MLTTLGGSPDTAYRMARCLRKTYHDGKFVVFVDTLCKSAGTLITLAADELVMSDNAHLGPLDIQVPEKEEVGEMSSGLTPTQAPTTLKMEAWRLFDDHFARLRYRPGFRFSTKMAGQIAARMTIGLLRPIYEQIDPMRLGENERSLRIAAEYGQRLASKNLKDRALARLVSGYPSHTFAIDRHEAKELFNNVREPTKEESALAASLDFLAEIGQDADERGDPATIYSISDIVYKSEQARIKDGEPNEQGHTRTDRVGCARRISGCPGFWIERPSHHNLPSRWCPHRLNRSNLAKLIRLKFVHCLSVRVRVPAHFFCGFGLSRSQQNWPHPSGNI